ncbi:hypothetical protein BCV71DRAFT_233474 [Rhizopus microsporus]|uniref:Uncharacterized protein n=2 Tax=Rhizopus TaxID=4842 RepID=A0A1X0S769_RHIZD|nr:hypothetical protein BCV71DRAFT_233474 [Rhizopus microsporus]
MPTSSSCTSLVLSPSSSTASLGSHWSTDSKRPRVAELIHLFETGSHPEQRRHSIDTCYHFHSRRYIQQRRFEYIPTLKEWEKRENKRPPIQLVSSQSTPVKRLVTKREIKINDRYSQRKVTSTRDFSWTPQFKGIEALEKEMNNKQLYERQVPSSNLFFLARDNASVKKKSEEYQRGLEKQRQELK